MLLQLHKSDKIVVDFDVALIVSIDRPTFPDLDTLHQPKKGGAVQLFKLGIIPDKSQPIVCGFLVLLAGIQTVQPTSSAVPASPCARPRTASSTGHTPPPG